MRDVEVEGRTGVVMTRIRGGELPGEVRVSIRGGSEDFIAYSVDEIARGETVLVFSSRGDRAVDVVRFPEAGTATPGGSDML